MTEYFVLFFAAIAVLIVAKLLAWPIKKIIKLAINIVVGIIMIILVNKYGVNIGISIDFNIITALIAGILGVPGVLLLIFLSFLR